MMYTSCAAVQYAKMGSVVFSVAFEGAEHFLVLLLLLELLEALLLALQLLQHDDDVGEEEDEDLQQDHEHYVGARVPSLITKR